MTGFRRRLPLLLFVFCLAAAPQVIAAKEDCNTRVTRLEDQNRQLHQQLRSAKRQLAQAQNAEQKPGWPQILGGIGIIFGLFGIVVMFNAKKHK